MSNLSNVIAVNVPVQLVPGNTLETFNGCVTSCTYCHGKGVFERERSRDLSEKDYCPVCGGSGKIQARITIEWNGVP